MRGTQSNHILVKTKMICEEMPSFNKNEQMVEIVGAAPTRSKAMIADRRPSMNWIQI